MNKTEKVLASKKQQCYGCNERLGIPMKNINNLNQAQQWNYYYYFS